MPGRRPFVVLATLALALNAAGWIWVRSSLRTAPPPTDGAPVLPTPAPHLEPAIDDGPAQIVAVEPTPSAGLPPDVARIVVRLDRALPAADAAAALAFAPALRGRWTNDGDATLAFELAEPLPRGRRIALTTLGDAIVAPDTPIALRTEPVHVVGVKLLAVDDEDCTVELRFDAPVEPAVVASACTIAVEPEDPTRPLLPFDVVTREPADAHVLRVDRLGATRIAVRLDTTLRSVGAEDGLPTPVAHRLSLPAIFAVLHAEAEPAVRGEPSTLSIALSAPLDERQPTPTVELEPPVACAVRVRGRVLRLEGRFEPGVRQRVRVPAALRAADGRVLADRVELDVDVPAPSPRVVLPDGDGILVGAAGRRLRLETIDVPRVELEIRRLVPAQLVASLAGLGGHHTTTPVIARTIEIATTPHARVRTDLALDDLLGADARGTYVATVRDPRRGWRSDRAVVSISDLGLAWKAARDAGDAWVVSLRTGAPRPGVRVRALGPAGLVLGEGITDAEGRAHLDVPDAHPDGPLFVVVAEAEGDLSVLQPSRRTWAPEAADDGGRRVARGMDALLYADRGVHRPGETVHLTAVVRLDDGAVPDHVPLQVRLLRPDGALAAETTIRADAARQGMAHADFPLDAAARTGTWRAEVRLPGGAEALAAIALPVEPFVPLRLAVRLEAPAAADGSADVPVTIAAEHLAGGPARDLAASLDAHVRPTRYASETHAAFVFDAPVVATPSLVARKSGTLDADGRWTSEIPVAALPATGSIEVEGSVTELGGRTIARSTRIPFDRAPAHLGVALAHAPVLSSVAPIEIAWCAVDRAGHPAALPDAALAATLETVEIDWIVERRDGERRWTSLERTTPVSEWAVPLDDAARSAGAGTLVLAPPAPGRYRLTLRAPALDVACVADFHATDGAVAGARGPDPETVELTLVETPVRAGGTASVLVRGPFAGTALLAIESDAVHETRVVSIPADGALATIAVPATLRGDAFLTATLVRGVEPTGPDWRPHRARGAIRLPIDARDAALTVTINAPSDAEPQDEIAVRATIAGPDGPCAGVVHLWAVDEGALLATDWHVPDPARRFRGPRALAVRSTDLFGDLLPDLAAGAGDDRTGADAEMARRRPRPLERDATAVLWRQAVPVGADGTLDVRLRLPDLQAAVRIMAVAVSGDRYGAAERAVRVASPVVVQAHWPRTLAPGDAALVPVRVANRTAQLLTIALDVAVDGDATIALVDPATLALAAGAETVRTLRCTAGADGRLPVRVIASFDDPAAGTRTVVASSTVIVRGAVPLAAERAVTTLEPGASMDLAPLADWQAGTAVRTVLVAGRLDAALRPTAERLVAYPYGCAEQTSSRLVALAAARTGAVPLPASPDAIDALLDAGVARLWAMQDASGLLAMWPRGRAAGPWLSAYAAQALAEVAARGRPIDPRFLEPLLAALGRALDATGTAAPTDAERAALCAALAAHGAPPLAWMTVLAERSAQLDATARAELADAWVRAGRLDRAAALLDDVAATAPAATADGAGRLDDPLRARALQFRTLRTIDPDDPRLDLLALELAQRAARASTLGAASAILALAPGMDAGASDADAAGAYALDDDAHVLGRAEPLREHALGAGAPVLRNLGAAPLVVVRVEDGIPADGRSAASDAGIAVRRRRLDADGAEIGNRPLRAGELVIVEIALSTDGLPRGTTLRNLAVVDLLPGGLEIEQPRLVGATSAARRAVDSSSMVDAVEFHDDRVLVFASADARSAVFRYAARATCAGTFVDPPIQASSMYDASIASVHGGGTLEIVP